MRSTHAALSVLLEEMEVKKLLLVGTTILLMATSASAQSTSPAAAFFGGGGGYVMSPAERAKIARAQAKWRPIYECKAYGFCGQ